MGLTGSAKERYGDPMTRKPKLGTIFQRKARAPDGTVVVLSTWWIQYSRGGRQFRESAKTEDYDEAERMLKRRQGEIATGAFSGLAPERIRISQLLQEMLDDMKANGRRSYNSAEGGVRLHLVPFMGKVRVADFGSNLVKAYKAKRQVEKAANATINRELGLLKRAFNLGYRAQPPLVAKVPYIGRLPERNVRTGFLEHEQYKKLRDALPDYLKLLFVLGYHTGARLGELRGITWPQVEAHRIVLYPGTTKNGDGRALPIYGEMAGWIEMAKENRKQFPKCRYLCQRDGKPLGESCVRKAWETACTSVGLPELHFHDLRRSAVRNMDRAGVPRTIAMRVSGHKTESMFNRYNIVSERDVAEVKNRMESYLSSLGNITLSSTLDDSEPAVGTQAPAKSLH
jgi:integrase